MGEIIFHVFLLVVLGVFYNESLGINTARMTDPIGPAGFPRGIIYVAAILLIASLVSTIKNYKKNKPEGKEKLKELDPGFLTVLAMIVAFVLSVGFVGFWFGGIIVIAVVMWVLNERTPVKLVAVSLIGALVFTFVFGKILSIPLPRGVAFFEMVSYWIY